MNTSERKRKIEALFSNPGTDGERQAAASATERIRARLAALEAAEPAVEFRFTMTDTWSRSLLLAVLRRHGVKAYRYSGQRHTTVMVKVASGWLSDMVPDIWSIVPAAVRVSPPI